MEKIIELMLEVAGYMPPQLMVVGIISYLIWFHQSHKKEHAAILKRLEDGEQRDLSSAKELEGLYKLVLRASIVNRDIPKSARLDMYDEYKAKGFNSWVDKYVEENLLSPEPPHNRRNTDETE